MIFDLISVLIIFLIYFFFFQKFEILSDDTSYSDHKKFIKNQKSPILLGGIFLITIFIIFSNYSFFPIKFSFFLIFLLGLFSDKNLFSNPKLRLLMQLFILIYIIFYQDLKILDLRVDQFNLILSNNFFNLFFTTFCLAILINGCNFVDGLNGLLTGYSILILSSIIFLNSNFAYLDIINLNFLYILIFSLTLFFIFNLFGLVYLGDNGSYIISLFLGVYLITISMSNQYLSPYYIASMLWYPAFENLFSFVRRIKSRKNISSADNLHFHQILYAYIDRYKIFKNSDQFSNNLSSLLILIMNLPGFIFSSIYPFNTKLLVFIIFCNIFIYLSCYFFLIPKNFKNK
tara:strand:+ start:1396 stop:2430 length:1035 start_codon:yes stop_codon:yes gene_type:complete